MTVPPNPPSNDPRNLRERLAVTASMEAFSGPLPRPADLEFYEKIVPGAAERILTMAEKQGAHRQEIEKIVVKSGARDSFFE